jgi:hypothetical protein
MPADSAGMFKALLALVVLAAVVAGGGYWNYQRNAYLVADVEVARPYGSLSDSDFKQLLAAYEAQAQRARGGVSNTPGEADQVDAYDSSDVGGRAQGFESFQRQNDKWKRERGHAMEEEAMVQALRKEKALRDRGLDDPAERFWLRLTTF